MMMRKKRRIKRSELLLCCALLAGCGSGSRSGDADADVPAEPVSALLVRHCSVCHAPPSPRLHAKSEWPNVIARMDMHRVEARMPALSRDEHDEVLAYLQAHAK